MSCPQCKAEYSPGEFENGLCYKCRPAREKISDIKEVKKIDEQYGICTSCCREFSVTKLNNGLCMLCGPARWKAFYTK
jgi:hypothetical protein